MEIEVDIPGFMNGILLLLIGFWAGYGSEGSFWTDIISYTTILIAALSILIVLSHFTRQYL